MGWALWAEHRHEEVEAPWEDTKGHPGSRVLSKSRQSDSEGVPLTLSYPGGCSRAPHKVAVVARMVAARD